MKIGRNAPCPCGSGKKYKKCCMNKTQPPVDLLRRRLSEAHDQLVQQLMQFAEESFGDMALLFAAGEFLLWPETEEQPGDLLADHMPLFMPWFLFNWTYEPPEISNASDEDESEEMDIRIDMPANQSIARIYAERQGKGMDSLQKRLIEALDGLPFTFLEVVSCKPGHGFRLRDILTGSEAEVLEKQGSENARPGDMLLGRIIQVDHVAMLMGCSSILIPPKFKPTVVDFRKALREEAGKITPEVLVEYEYEIRQLYFHFFDSLSGSPRLQNTDGDPLLFHTLHFTIEDPQAAFDRLVDLAVVEDAEVLRGDATRDADGRIVRAEIPWSKHGNEMHKGWDNTLLGRLVIDGEKLTAEVNSEARAKAVRREIEARLGAGVTYKTTTVQSPEAMMEKGPGTEDDDAGETLSQEELMQIPEVRQQLEQMLRDHWDGWVDERIPALGNRSPRQAVRSAGGREKVEALLLDARRNMHQDPVMQDLAAEIIDGVRARLGLDGAPAGDGRQKGKKTRPGKERRQQRVEDVRRLIEDFGRSRLDTQHTAFALKLCDRIARMRKLNLQRGRTEIWAAAIVYVIARLNFLFDPKSELFITADDICDHFGTRKGTVSSKATGIEKACGLAMGDKDLCRAEITDMFTFHETPQGFIVPKNARPELGAGSASSTPKPPSHGTPASGQGAPEKKKRRGVSGRHDEAGGKESRQPPSRQLKLFDDP